MASKDILSTADIHPELVPLWDAISSMPPLHGDLEAVRRSIIERKKEMTAVQGGGPTETVTEENITVTARDGFQIPCVLYKPATPPSNGSPLVVIFHGGGFVAGSTINEELNCRNFTAQLGCTCLNVDYRLAPEYPYPTPSNDAWDSTKWAAANAASLGADPTQGFIIAGTSAGGNLTDVVAHIARDEKLAPPITGLIEMIPALIPPGQPPANVAAEYLAWEQNKEAPIIPRVTTDWMMDLYKPDNTSHRAWPFIHPDGHEGIPPVFFQVCGMDPLRDDAVIYERILREEYGVKTQLKMYRGVPHGFWSAFGGMDLAKQFVRDTTAGVEWLLSLVGK